MEATVPVTEYEVLAVFVGGSGSDGGLNGGGGGMGTGSHSSSGGGGASDVRVDGTKGRIVDAGGGGGAGAPRESATGAAVGVDFTYQWRPICLGR